MNVFNMLFLVWLCHAACGILVPQTGIEPLQWEHSLNQWTYQGSPQIPLSLKQEISSTKTR